jgi:hypothetical protein
VVCATEEEIARKRKSRKPNLITKQLSGPVTKDMFDAPFSKWITIARELALLPSLVLDAGVQRTYLPTCGTSLPGARAKGDSNVDLKQIGRRALPEGHPQVLDIGPGSISSLMSDDSGYYVYRFVSSEIPRFEDIRQQLMVEVQSRKQNQAFRNIQKAPGRTLTMPTLTSTSLPKSKKKSPRRKTISSRPGAQ